MGAAFADLLLGGPWPRLALLPGGRRAVWPAAEQQQGHRAEPERLDDRERAQDRQHDERAADDAEHTHEAREQAHSHRVEADHHPAEAQRQRGEPDRLGAGIPISWAVISRDELPMSAARSTVRGPSRNVPISDDVPRVNMIVAIAPRMPPASAT